MSPNGSEAHPGGGFLAGFPSPSSKATRAAGKTDLSLFGGDVLMWIPGIKWATHFSFGVPGEARRGLL